MRMRNGKDIKEKLIHFEKLVIPFYTTLYKYIFLIVRDDYACDDVFQDTLIKAFINLDSLKDKKKFKNWIFRIAKNQCMLWIKKHKKYVPLEDNTLECMADDCEYYLPENFVIKQETKKIVIDIVNNLDPKYRDIIILKYYNMLTEQEISQVLNIKRGTVKSRHKRAKDKIYRKLVVNGYFKTGREE